MEKNVYLLLSYIFHPIFIPLYIVGVCFTADIYPIYFLSPDQKLLLLAMLLVNTLILPVLGVFVMKRFGIISSYHLEERKERLYPYLYFFALYVATALMLLINAFAPIILSYIYFVSASLVFVLVVFNTYSKISAHTSSIASFATILIVLDFRNILHLNMGIIALIFLCGLIGTARLSLHAHSFKEVSIGYVSGIAVTLIASQLLLF